MEVKAKTLKEYTLLDILCHCLWEMTFWGFTTASITEARNELENMINETEKEGTL